MKNDTLFSLAQQSLLAPNALEARHLQQVFEKMLAHKVDYADLYFQTSRAESWSLEEGMVKSGSFGIEQGVGVRAPGLSCGENDHVGRASASGPDIIRGDNDTVSANRRK